MLVTWDRSMFYKTDKFQASFKTNTIRTQNKMKSLYFIYVIVFFAPIQVCLILVLKFNDDLYTTKCYPLYYFPENLKICAKIGET